jgi:hypothetical protein
LAFLGLIFGHFQLFNGSSGDVSTALLGIGFGHGYMLAP